MRDSPPCGKHALQGGALQEGIQRAGQGEEFYAAAGGVEYTFTSIGKSAADIGFIMEYAWDSRGEDAATLYNNDLMAGIRLALNDLSGTELLAGYVEDMEHHSRIASVQASRRIGSSIKATLEAYSFLNIHKDDIGYDLRDDDYIQLEIMCYF